MSSPETGTENIRIVGAKRFIIAIAVLLTLLGAIFTTVMAASSEFVDQANECIGRQWACLASHVHTPNRLVIATPTWSPDPFTTTSTFVLLPGLITTLTPQNASHGLWFMAQFMVTMKILPSGTASISLFVDGAQSGAGIETQSSTPTTVTGLFAENATFANLPPGPHVFDLRVSSSNALDTVSVYAMNTAGTGDFVTLLTLTDLSSAAPS